MYNNFIKIPFKFSTAPAMFKLLITLITYLLPTLQVFVTASFINEALLLLEGKSNWKNLILQVFLFTLIISYNRLYVILNNILNCRIGNDLRLKFNTKVVEKRSQLDYSEIENEEVWNLIKRVSHKPEDEILKGLNALLEISGILLQAVGLIIILFVNVWWSTVIVIIVIIPIVFISIKGGREQYESKRQVAGYERRYEYLYDVLTKREFSEERSLFEYEEKISAKWLHFYNKAKNIELKIVIKWLVGIKAISSATSLITFTIAFILIPPISRGDLSVGLFIALVQASNSLISLTSWNLSDSLNNLAKYIEYIKDFVVFNNLSETKGSLDLPSTTLLKFESIEFKKVYFKYPGSDKYVLEGFDFKLNAGDHCAIVGKNGSGKTTLIKLLTGLYSDFEGEILINNKSILDYDLSDLKSIVSVLFQDFNKYYISIYDNIAIGDINTISNKNTIDRINNITKLIGLNKFVNDLPKGLDTNLGKLQEDGIDLSGGQWQRIAMARLMISSAPVRILDEPTAALDPISESQLYNDFSKISKGWTTIFISHRLASTKLANIINVLDNGKIIQNGTHDQLISEEGLYKEMYDSQRGWYK